MSNTERTLLRNIVTQSNSLIEASYDTDLTATEHKIIRYALGKTKWSRDSFPKVVFSVSEFLEAGGISGRGYHNRIDKVADELSKKRIKIKTIKNTTWIPWLAALVYDDGYVYLTFNALIEDLLFGIESKGEYTKYDFRYIGDMRSGYTIRLYELLKQYAPIGSRKFKIDVLKNMLGIGDKYKQYGHFKSRVLSQAKKELDERKEMTFNFEEVRKGRKVSELIFYIHTHNKKKKVINKADVEQKAFIKEAQYLLNNFNYSVSDKKIKQWSIYGVDLLNEVLIQIHGRDIGNPSGYIDAVLKSMYRENKRVTKEFDANQQQKSWILEFIKTFKSDEILPEWFVEQKFHGFMGEHCSKEELEQIWKNNESDILKKVCK